MIFTSENLDKLDELAENLEDLTTKDSEYYVSKSANANDSKSNRARYLKTVTRITDVQGNVTDTRNGIFQQKKRVTGPYIS